MIGYSSTSDINEDGFDVKAVADAATDAPHYVLLNVVPGRPDSSLFKKKFAEDDDKGLKI